MKKLMAFAVVSCVAASAFVSCGGSASLKSDEDSVSYAFGMNLGKQLKEDKVIEFNVFLEGLKDSYAGKEKINADEINRIVNEYFNVKLPAKNLDESNKYLAEIEKSNPNVKKTESGLLYEVIVAGDPNVKATKNEDMVKVVYHGQLKDGSVFDSSKDRGDTVEFALNRVIPGWSEGMKLVGKGGKIKLWLPSNLAYGEYGSGNGSIGANEAITFEVDLVDVTSGVATPEAVATEGAQAMSIQ